MRALFGPRPDGAPLVKICGLRRIDDIEAAIAAGADLLGIVFAPSRRQVEPAVAAGLVRAGGGAVPVVGVFVDSPAEEVRAVVRTTGIDLIQLSGSENPMDYVRIGVPCIKVVHRDAGRLVPSSLHINTWYPAIAGLIIDSWSPQGGGSGRQADWAAAQEVVKDWPGPVLLAGGLHAGNVRDAIGQTGVAGVDVSSGVERDGVKDPELIRAFVQAARTSAPPASNTVSSRDIESQTHR